MATPYFIKKHLNQDMVYWGNPQDDGEGGYEFDDPIPIKGRCEYKTELVMTGMGEEKVSRARVYVEQKLDEGGYLYLGTLEDSNIGDDQLPKSTQGSMKILAIGIVPNLKATESLYRAFVNM